MSEAVPDAAVKTHWLVNLDTAWGCDGCDWTGKLDDYWKTHGRPSHDIPF